MKRSRIVFRVASEPWELEQIHRLNRDVFAHEIPQHEADGDRLVDRFHDQNTYVVAVDGDRVVGMLAVRDQRPFSLDEKLPGLDAYLPSGKSVCEVRLLAIPKDRRKGTLLAGLLGGLWELGEQRGYDAAVLSAYVPRVGLYQRLGCSPFGPRVGGPDLQFQPMIATRQSFADAVARVARIERDPAARAAEPRNFLPGPVRPTAAVRRAFSARPISHRGAEFHATLARAKQLLHAATGAPRVEIFLGSGTLANDVVAAQIGLLPGSGVVLSNGEFGRRLEDHARRHRLRHAVVRAPWGEPFSRAAVEVALAAEPAPSWLWLVHCETSTGVLNDLDGLRELCAARRVRLCADCISSLGTVPVALDALYLASGVSGKGFRALPGLSLVFYDHDVAPQPDGLPRYLDLGLYAQAAGVPFTHSSNLLGAFAAALEEQRARPPFAELREAAIALRRRLRGLGLAVLAAEEHASPAVFTLTLPSEQSSRTAGDRLRDLGFLLSYESAYLLERNWIQICLMSGAEPSDLDPLLSALAQVAASGRRASDAASERAVAT